MTENYAVFRYGFLSAQVSRALQQYSDCGELSIPIREKLLEGHQLLTDIVTTQKLFTEKNEADRGVSLSRHALDAFNCALDVILSNPKTFSVHDVPSFASFFQQLYQTLHALVSDESSASSTLTPERIATTRAFFEKLADAMLAQLSLSDEAPEVGEESRSVLAA